MARQVIRPQARWSIARYWAQFNPKTQALVRGECVHPVTGGTGGFKGVKGIIHMVDRPAGKEVKTTYTLARVLSVAVGSLV